MCFVDWIGIHLYSISATVIASGMRNVPSKSSFSTEILRSCASFLVLKLSQPSRDLHKPLVFLNAVLPLDRSV